MDRQTVGRGPYRDPYEEMAEAWEARQSRVPWGLTAFVAVLGVGAALSVHSAARDRSRAVVDAPRYHRAAVLWAAHAYPERVARAVCEMGHAGQATCTVTVDAVPPIRLRCGMTVCAVEWPEASR